MIKCPKALSSPGYDRNKDQRIKDPKFHKTPGIIPLYQGRKFSSSPDIATNCVAAEGHKARSEIINGSETEVMIRKKVIYLICSHKLPEGHELGPYLGKVDRGVNYGVMRHLSAPRETVVP
ncbi:hypothetical protein AVEN_21311-1 [Araneus ventricosus]|uniref:Uncharacterized protein n=1 Tax=Araneus ventricosus TaxID=182803 RepID=A0A4Y2J4K6_ARAVE|nr:hypothetical protein AVEN_21311-1 [Araneus ventricosus]